MICNLCGAQFDGKFCPDCGAPTTAEAATATTIPAVPVVAAKKKKPIFKKWWFWVIAAVVVIGIISSSSENGETTTDNNTDSSITQSNGETTKEETKNKTDSKKITVADFSTMSKADIESWASTNKLTVKFSEDYSNTIASGSVISQDKKANETVNEGATIKVVISKGKKPSIEYLNALKKAESYSNMMHMSKKAIYKQLTSEYGEKFPADAAQYAIDNLNADFNANALAKAKSYQQTMSMSKSAIYDQLVSEYGEQFTAEEAQYAIDHLDD